MIKKLFLAVLLVIIALFLKTSFVSAKTECGWQDTSMSKCDTYAASREELCCHTKSGCSSGCGNIPWYGWCHIDGCKAYVCTEMTSCAIDWWNPSDPYGIGACIEEVAWKYTMSQCSAVDSCTGGPKLRSGLCSAGGCEKGPYYKVCCDNVTNALIAGTCSGSNFSGVCPSGSYTPGPNILSCPGGGVTPGITPGVTPGITPGVTPALPDCGHTCLNNGTASVGWPDCSCTNRSPASGYTKIGTWNSSDCSQCTGYRFIGGGPTSTPAPTNTPIPTPTTPPPSCSVSLSPNSLSLTVGSSDLITANVAVQNASVNRVDFSSTDSGVASVDPASDSGSPYRTQVTGRSVGSAQVNASVSLSPSGSCSTGTPSVVSVEAAGWFQTEGGTIHAEGNLSDDIPATAVDRNMSIDQDGFPGVISHQSTTDANFGNGYPSADDASHWLAKSSYQGKNFGSWDFFKKKYAREMQTEDFDGTLPNKDGIYYSSSGKTLQGNWNVPANRWLVIMVEGNINVSIDIIVSDKSFLALVSANNIIFESSVSQAQGMFIADGSIDTNSGATQFQAEGFFAASQFILGRDLGDAINPTTPAELFTFRPDFLINSYKDTDYNLWWFDFKWEEIAP